MTFPYPTKLTSFLRNRKTNATKIVSLYFKTSFGFRAKQHFISPDLAASLKIIPIDNTDVGHANSSRDLDRKIYNNEQESTGNWVPDKTTIALVNWTNRTCDICRSFTRSLGSFNCLWPEDKRVGWVGGWREGRERTAARQVTCAGRDRRILQLTFYYSDINST